MHDGLEKLGTRIQKVGLESACSFDVRKVIGIGGWKTGKVSNRDWGREGISKELLSKAFEHF